MKALKLLKDLYNNPTVQYHVRRAGRKLAYNIEKRTLGYKKKDKKLFDMIDKQQKKLAKKQKVNYQDVKMSDKDIDKAIYKEDRIIKKYEEKRPKVFDKASKLNKGGVVRGTGASGTRNFRMY
jgi:DNA-directed RNA polymerase beta' subunit